MAGTSPPSSGAGTRRRRIALVAILTVAALLRIPALALAPPGLHQDEACNAWNAWCLLKTGGDAFGTRWPIFCLRGLGDYRTTPFIYLLIPFEAVGGLNVTTVRLAAALGGIATVALVYLLGRRWFGTGVGLAAAAFLAIDPTHVQLSRLALEASQGPLLTLLPVLLLAWAGFPLHDAAPQPRVGRALLAGLVTGACCYGYPAARLFIPVYLVVAAVLSWRAWWGLVRTRAGRTGVLALLCGLAVTFGPLAIEHIRHAETIAKRGAMTWIWQPDDSAATRVAKVAARFARHFNPWTLFVQGDEDETFWTVPHGFLATALLPWTVVGLVAAVGTARKSRVARLLLLGVLLYPAGDATNWHAGLHGLRCAAGLWPWMLLGGLGFSRTVELLHRQRMQAALTAAAVAAAALVGQEWARFLPAYGYEHPRKPRTYYGTHGDLLAACDRLGPALTEADRVICVAYGPYPGVTPYLVFLTALHYDPQQWLKEPREYEAWGPWDRCARFGRFHFLERAEREALEAKLRDDGRPERVLFILRPDDEVPGPPIATINDPNGKPVLVLYDCEL